MYHDTIKSFSGSYDWLSNFYSSVIKANDLSYPTVEHYFQSMKMLHEYDAETVRLLKTPGQAKRAGRNFPMKPEWDSHLKYTTMGEALLLKFTQHKQLHDLLLATGDAILIEGNLWHDNIWGKCQCSKCGEKISHNLLGRKLMELRGILNEKIQ